MLYCVVGHLLCVLREHDAVDLAASTFADQGHLLAHLRKATAHGRYRPLHIGIAIDRGSVMCKVPRIASPVLQLT